MARKVSMRHVFQGLWERLPVLRQLLRRPVGFASCLVVLVVVIVALLAPEIAPHNPYQIDVVHRFAPPSWGGHLLGTDYLGRDLLSRVIFGAQTALEIAIPAVVIGLLPGLILGLVGGYVGGVTDRLVNVVIDTLLSFPAVILALALLTLVGRSKVNTVALIAIALVPGYGRLARAQTLTVKQNPYIEAERSLGASRRRIILRHILPNIIPPLLVLMAMDIPSAISTEAGLAFLGLGVQAPAADWGIMLNDGFITVQVAPWPLVGPLVALVIVTTTFTVLGETIRDVTDPKLAGAFRAARRRGRVMRRLRLVPTR